MKEIIKTILVVFTATWVYTFLTRVLSCMDDPFEDIVDYIRTKFRKDRKDDGQEQEEKERIE